MTLTQEGKASPLGAIDGVCVLNRHGDTFDLPVGATRLASQAFTYGPKVLALLLSPWGRDRRALRAG
jgi:GMP synthase (glutamine-hydrolysing)